MLGKQRGSFFFFPFRSDSVVRDKLVAIGEERFAWLVIPQGVDDAGRLSLTVRGHSAVFVVQGCFFLILVVPARANRASSLSRAFSRSLSRCLRHRRRCTYPLGKKRHPCVYPSSVASLGTKTTTVTTRAHALTKKQVSTTTGGF